MCEPRGETHCPHGTQQLAPLQTLGADPRPPGTGGVAPWVGGPHHIELPQPLAALLPFPSDQWQQRLSRLYASEEEGGDSLDMGRNLFPLCSLGFSVVSLCCAMREP